MLTEQQMASNSENVNQDVIPIDFNLGDFVWTRWHGKTRIISYAIICPAFGSNDQYTKVDESQGSWPIRYYHVQRLGQLFEQDWISEIELNLVEHDDLKEMGMSKDECKVFKKTNEERVEMCRIRAKANQTPADFENNGKLLESKTQNEQLKNELWRLKEFTKDRETMKNDLKTLKETQSDIKKSIEDLKNKVMSQNQNKTQNVQGIGSNNDSANAGNEEQNSFCFEQPVKKIKMEDQNGEIQRLTQIIKDLKDNNSKLSVENTKLSTEIAKLSQ